MAIVIGRLPIQPNIIAPIKVTKLPTMLIISITVHFYLPWLLHLLQQPLLCLSHSIIPNLYGHILAIGPSVGCFPTFFALIAISAFAAFYLHRQAQYNISAPAFTWFKVHFLTSYQRSNFACCYPQLVHFLHKYTPRKQLY